MPNVQRGAIPTGSGQRQRETPPESPLSSGEALGPSGRTFTLILRIVTPDLAPFSNHEGWLTWGTRSGDGSEATSSRYRARLDDQGYVQIQNQQGEWETPVLNAEVPVGKLELGYWEEQDTEPVLLSGFIIPIYAQKSDTEMNELGYRLANLGLLPVDDWSVSRWPRVKPDRTREAGARYAFKYGFRERRPTTGREAGDPRYGERHLINPSGDLKKEVLQHIKKLHDGE